MKLSECYYQLGDRIQQTLIRLNPGFGPTVVVAVTTLRRECYFALETFFVASLVHVTIYSALNVLAQCCARFILFAKSKQTGLRVLRLIMVSAEIPPDQ